ncbi:MAG: hypothetical protein HGA80_03010 [Candidatus Omnitrophica bacterium]|nr:hypothetical protein [Candidatus Omnitrophota bacterium]
MRIVMTLLLVLSCCLTCGQAGAQSKTPFVARVKSDRVYVRAGQNVNFATVAVVNKGDTLVVLSQSYGWCRVKVPAQTKAYIKAEYAVLTTPEIGEITADKVNVRCAASTDAGILGKLERGNRFYVRAKEGDWLAIKPVDQLSAWVKEEFLEPVKGASVPSLLYPSPTTTAAAAATSVTPAWSKFIKKLAGDQVEINGTLKKDEQGTYRIYKDTTAVCIITGPEAVLKGFVGSLVDVQGRMSPANGTDLPVVKLSKINLVL